HPWTNGQVERMNRTIKEATVKRFYYETHNELREHLANFVAAYNFAKRLKTLQGLTPYEFICKCWIKEPQRFTSNPRHQIPGPNIWSPKLSDQLEQRSTATAALRTTTARRTNAPGAPPSRQALDRRCRVMGGWWTH